MTVPRPSVPAVTRLRRPGWRDPRLLIGIVAIAGSVAVGSWAVTAGAETSGVYAAGATLVPGQALDAGDLRIVQVRWEAGSDRYLAADAGLPDGLVATRLVEEGELVPIGAVGPADRVDARSVPIRVDGGLSRGLRVGSTVDLWHVPEGSAGQGDTGEPGTPRLVAAGLVVTELDDSSGPLSVASSASLHVLVPAPEIPEVLGALAGPGQTRVVSAVDGAS